MAFRFSGKHIRGNAEGLNLFHSSDFTRASDCIRFILGNCNSFKEKFSQKSKSGRYPLALMPMESWQVLLSVKYFSFIVKVGNYNRFTCFSAKKNPSSFLCSTVFTLCLKNSVSLRPRPPEYPVSSDWSAHTRLNQCCAGPILTCQTSCQAYMTRHYI